MGFMGLIWLSESDSSRVGFSGNGFSKMCCGLLQAAMAELSVQYSSMGRSMLYLWREREEKKKGTRVA